MKGLSNLDVIPCFKNRGSQRWLAIGPEYWGGKDKKDEDAEEGYEKFYVELKKTLIEKYGWGRSNDEEGFKREDWARDAMGVWRELDARYGP